MKVAIVTGSRDWTGRVLPVEHLLEAPLHWRKPRAVFPNSTGHSSGFAPL